MFGFCDNLTWTYIQNDDKSRKQTSESNKGTETLIYIIKLHFLHENLMLELLYKKFVAVS